MTQSPPVMSGVHWPQPVLDRVTEARGDIPLLRTLWTSARVLVVDESGAFPVSRDAEGVHLAGEQEPFDPQIHLLVGRVPEGAWFARRGPVSGETATLRDAGLSTAERQVAEAAVAMLTWHQGRPVCEKCHRPTEWVPGGGTRRCDEGHENFPRTDPAVIVAVRDSGDRLLLAHQVTWPHGRCSVLAGFVEAGESAEAAVLREISEEVQLGVHSVRYLHSQPWPFPRSLMLAFSARGDGDLRPDGQEIEWARWFGRDELHRELTAGRIQLPGPASIAGRMIHLWQTQEL
ncbi:MAG TPA: NAD(+) diphosphatase [Propionibacteriaceae bacterium]|nr:NAD(+) diphosphatase [Propionibacteriaceae bacterium]